MGMIKDRTVQSTVIIRPFKYLTEIRPATIRWPVLLRGR